MHIIAPVITPVGDAGSPGWSRQPHGRGTHVRLWSSGGRGLAPQGRPLRSPGSAGSRLELLFTPGAAGTRLARERVTGTQRAGPELP